jgi:nucleoside phosphorylase
VNVGCSPRLLDRFQAGARLWTGSRVHVGTVLTSNAVVNSEALVVRLRDDFPDAIAGEMEATAVHEAASVGSKPDWIMVKAICDWGFAKDNSVHVDAAGQAAQFVLSVIAAGGLPRRADAE